MIHHWVVPIHLTIEGPRLDHLGFSVTVDLEVDDDIDLPIEEAAAARVTASNHVKQFLVNRAFIEAGDPFEVAAPLRLVTTSEAPR